MLVRDLMTTDFKTARPDTALRQAAEMMRDGDFGYLPVIDGDRLAGAITDRDMVVRALAEGHDGATPLSQVMSQDLIYCLDDDEIGEAADLMKREQVRRLAVLNSVKRMVGVITLGDIARIGYNTKLTGDIETEVAQP